MSSKNNILAMFKRMVSMATDNEIVKNGVVPTKSIISQQTSKLGTQLKGSWTPLPKTTSPATPRPRRFGPFFNP